MTNRRAFLTAALVVPVAIAAPSIAQTFTCSLDPVDRYWAATEAVNANRLGEDAYVQAINDLDRWEPPTPRDFLRKFIAQYHDGGCPTEDDRIAMITQAERLLS